MSSLFDSEVAANRKRMPFTTISLQSFISQMIWCGTEKPHENQVVLTVAYRHDVSTRMWFTLSWTDEDEKRHTVSSQEFGLLMWRAATISDNVARKLRDEQKGVVYRIAPLGKRTENDSEFTDYKEAYRFAFDRSDDAAIEIYDAASGQIRTIIHDRYTFRSE